MTNEAASDAAGATGNDPEALTGDGMADLAREAARRRAVQIVGRIAVFVFIMLVWQFSAGNLVRTFYLPKPFSVLMELSEWVGDGSLFRHIWATIVPAAKGLSIAVIAALLLGYALAMARSAAGIFEPYVAAMYGIPIISVVPLMILWFGIGQNLAVAVSTLASFFLMFYNAYFGIRDVSQVLVDQVSIAGGSKWDIAIRVRLPSALVWLVAGLKVAVPHALVGVVVAEFLVADRGLGYLLANNASQFNSAGTFAAIIVLATIVFIIDRAMFLVTRRALMWKEAGHHTR